MSLEIKNNRPIYVQIISENHTTEIASAVEAFLENELHLEKIASYNIAGDLLFCFGTNLVLPFSELSAYVESISGYNISMPTVYWANGFSISLAGLDTPSTALIAKIVIVEDGIH